MDILDMAFEDEFNDAPPEYITLNGKVIACIADPMSRFTQDGGRGPGKFKTQVSITILKSTSGIKFDDIEPATNIIYKNGNWAIVDYEDDFNAIRLTIEAERGAKSTSRL